MTEPATTKPESARGVPARGHGRPSKRPGRRGSRGGNDAASAPSAGRPRGWLAFCREGLHGRVGLANPGRPRHGTVAAGRFHFSALPGTPARRPAILPKVTSPNSVARAAVQPLGPPVTLSPMTHPFLDLAPAASSSSTAAMGTSLHRYHPTDEDWGTADGKSLVNLSDALAYTHPEWIRDIHRGFLAAGCDAVETNTFNATHDRPRRVRHGRQARRDQPARTSGSRRRRPREFSTPDRPRFVVGSVGPGTKMPSLTDPAIYADFDTLADAYRPQLAVMIEERVDAILIETCFDILQAKCVAITAIEEMKRAGRPAAADGAAHDHRRQTKKMLARHRHPGGPGRPRAARRDRRDRHELRRRPGPDARRHPAPEPAQRQAAQRAAERRAAARRAATRRTSRSSRTSWPTGWSGSSPSTASTSSAAAAAPRPST